MNHISQCLNSKLIEIFDKATKLQKLSAKIHDYFPKSLQGHYQVSSFTNGCLVLTTLDSVWATQLRYFIPELRDKLRGEAGLYQLTSIKVVIDNAVPTASAVSKRKPITLSNKARQIISDSEVLITYEPLRLALKRLSED